MSQIENGADSRGLEDEVFGGYWRMFGIRLDGWMVGVGRPVTCRINGCGGGGAAGGSWCGRGAEPRSAQGRTTPGHTGPLREDHTAPPRATEPGATVARCQPHLPTTPHHPTQPKKGLNFELLLFKLNFILYDTRCF